jgi:hypothetical protein
VYIPEPKDSMAPLLQLQEFEELDRTGSASERSSRTPSRQMAQDDEDSYPPHAHEEFDTEDVGESFESAAFAHSEANHQAPNETIASREQREESSESDRVEQSHSSKRQENEAESEATQPLPPLVQPRLATRTLGIPRSAPSQEPVEGYRIADASSSAAESPASAWPHLAIPRQLFAVSAPVSPAPRHVASLSVDQSSPAARSALSLSPYSNISNKHAVPVVFPTNSPAKFNPNKERDLPVETEMSGRESGISDRGTTLNEENGIRRPVAGRRAGTGSLRSEFKLSVEEPDTGAHSRTNGSRSEVPSGPLNLAPTGRPIAGRRSANAGIGRGSSSSPEN